MPTASHTALWLLILLAIIANVSGTPAGRTRDNLHRRHTKNFSTSTAHSGGHHARNHLPDLSNASLEELQEGLSRGKFSSVDLVNAYIARIGEVNDFLHAVTEINLDAIIIAKQLDQERKIGKVRGPLHGLPILLKNNIATADKLNTTAGSYALLGARVAEDATVVRKLREAGAIILGKTNMSEWANYRSVPSSNGWSALGGQTSGAYFPNQDPCGSSSGSGVAISIGLAFASLGTETDGSIVCPSDKSNIVGIKPTVGLTSRYNVIPISEHQDTVGPMARSVKDAAYMLQTIVGRDTNDNYTSATPCAKTPNYVAACKKEALHGVRIGVPRNVIWNPDSERWGESSEALTRAFDLALEELKKAGAIIVDPANFTNTVEALDADWSEQILIADFQVNLAQYLSRLSINPNNLTDLASVRAYTQGDTRENYPVINTLAWDATLAQGWNNTSPKFWQVYTEALAYVNDHGLIGTIREHKLNAMVMPTQWAPSWASIVGSPIISVPLGFYDNSTTEESSDSGELTEVAPGIPFGISFLGEKWSDEKLIGYAYAFEQQTQARKNGKPYLQPKIELSDILGKKQKL